MLNKFKTKLKSFSSSAKMKAAALSVTALSSASAFAQNTAGDYTAGITAIGTVATEITKYVPVVQKLCYAIAGVVAVVGAISVYIAMYNRISKFVQNAFKQHCNYAVTHRLTRFC